MTSLNLSHTNVFARVTNTATQCSAYRYLSAASRVPQANHAFSSTAPFNAAVYQQFQGYCYSKHQPQKWHHLTWSIFHVFGISLSRPSPLTTAQPALHPSSGRFTGGMKQQWAGNRKKNGNQIQAKSSLGCGGLVIFTILIISVALYWFWYKIWYRSNTK